LRPIEPLLDLCQSAHAPKLNKGTVIKTNDNQRYATNGESGFIVRELARRAGISVQVTLLVLLPLLVLLVLLVLVVVVVVLLLPLLLPLLLLLLLLLLLPLLL
jgi:Flp pilus assembly protein TadB